MKFGEAITSEKNRLKEWRLCNKVSESGGVPEDWRSAVIVPLHKCKGERTGCRDYRGTRLLSMVGKIYIGVLVDSL